MQGPPVADRWAPDEQLVEAVLAGGKHYLTKLPIEDQCWLVAGLMHRGYTAEEVADRLHCCTRKVWKVRAAPMTVVSMALLAEADHFTQELRLARSEAAGARSSLASALRERDQLRAQLVKATTPGMRYPMCSKGKHEMHPGNAYRYRDGRGRERVQCRGCHADRQAEYRAKVSA